MIYTMLLEYTSLAIGLTIIQTVCINHNILYNLHGQGLSK